jgi:hypothetical protein
MSNCALPCTSKLNLMESETTEDAQLNISGSQVDINVNGVTVPRVVKHGYRDFKTANGKWSASCNICRKTLADKIGVSSTFTKYVHLHALASLH